MLSFGTQRRKVTFPASLPPLKSERQSFLVRAAEEPLASCLLCASSHRNYLIGRQHEKYKGNEIETRGSLELREMQKRAPAPAPSLFALPEGSSRPPPAALL